MINTCWIGSLFVSLSRILSSSSLLSTQTILNLSFSFLSSLILFCIGRVPSSLLPTGGVKGAEYEIRKPTLGSQDHGNAGGS